MKKVLFILSLLISVSPAQADMLQLKDSLFDNFGLDLAGFIEGRGGVRTQNDDYSDDVSLAEARLQLDLAKDFGWGVFKAKGDLLADGVVDQVTGRMRELHLLFSPLDNMDMKIGRQILTWGTGDLLFINDFFAKDWQAFFIGRDDEYLKAPSNAIKGSVFFELINIDLVYIPVFEGSTHISGERLSYWNGALGRTAGEDYIFDLEERHSTSRDSEYAVRLARNISSMELALYGYNGFWQTPEGMIVPDLKLRYPRLQAYGASLRNPLLGGIGNIETGYYHSSQSDSGRDPLTRNSEYRLLLGFEREIASNFTAGCQYYLEWMMDYDKYEKTLAPGSPAKDEYRSVVTLRLTKLLMNQNLTLSLFTYYSPTDKDCYIRPKVQYKLTDQWRLEGGGNIFIGSDAHTFFGQFEDNTNVYAGVRWSF
ncbi:MAG: hypothetical protein KKD73_08455 [Proteobacteria bacterium]|nr:hypothetical protein [Pseudomonadota bacterium]MBU1641403.1 hypothetical protein [Pseudomonadota bacterium]